MTTMTNPVWVAGKYRLRNDDGNFANATWIAAENTSAQIALDTNFRIRISWGDSAGANQNNDSGVITLQYRIGSGDWTTVTGSTAVRTATSTHLSDGNTETTSRVSAPTGVSGSMLIAEFDTNNSAASRTLSNQYAEVEFNLRLNAADFSGGETVTFQILRGGQTFSSYDNTPTLTTPVQARTGSMAAVETGADAFSSSGTVQWPPSSGSMAASETGDDVFSASGTVEDSAQSSTGSMAAVEVGDDTLAASGQVIISGALGAIETGSDTFEATGGVLVSGSLSASEVGSDAFSATGRVVVTGSLSAQEVGDDQFLGIGDGADPGVTGSLSASESGDDALSAVGSVIISGSLQSSEVGQDQAAFIGQVGAVTGSLSAFETGADSFASFGVVLPFEPPPAPIGVESWPRTRIRRSIRTVRIGNR